MIESLSIAVHNSLGASLRVCNAHAYVLTRVHTRGHIDLILRNCILVLVFIQETFSYL